MKKLGKLLIILLILGALGYGAFMIFVNPSGYTNKEELAQDYFTNLNEDSACDTYFLAETKDVCVSLHTAFDGETFTIKDVQSSGETVLVTLSKNGVDETFTVYFSEVEVTGVKSTFNDVYYYIYAIN